MKNLQPKEKRILNPKEKRKPRENKERKRSLIREKLTNKELSQELERRKSLVKKRDKKGDFFLCSHCEYKRKIENYQR